MRFCNLLATTALLSLPLLIGCQQSTDTAAEVPAQETIEATPVNFANEKCPIMGGEPTPELTAQYRGKTIGFCCDGCPEKWAELSAEEKAEKFADVKVDSGDGDDHQHGDDGHQEAHDHSETHPETGSSAEGEYSESSQPSTR